MTKKWVMEGEAVEGDLVLIHDKELSQTLRTINKTDKKNVE